MQVNGTQIVIAVVSLVFTAVIAPLVRAVFVWLKTRTKSEALSSALSEAAAVADSVVAGLEATVVGAMKQRSADGKLSAEDAKSVAALAVDTLLRDLSAGALAVIERNTDDLAAYISNLIEARLAQFQK